MNDDDFNRWEFESDETRNMIGENRKEREIYASINHIRSHIPSAFGIQHKERSNEKLNLANLADDGDKMYIFLHQNPIKSLKNALSSS